MSPSLETFLNLYLETALWSSHDDSDEYMDVNYTLEDLDPETLAKAAADCEDFLTGTMPPTLKAFLDNLTEKELRSAGMDFWLTRNGHGAGFWDGDWPEPYATLLTDRAHSYGSVDLYVGDDGKIYS